MKTIHRLGTLLALALVIISTTGTVLKTPLRTKAKLRKAALKQSHRWARELMVVGVHSLSARRDSGWGAKALNQAYSKAFEDGSVAGGSKDFKSGKNQAIIGTQQAKSVQRTARAATLNFSKGLSLLKMSDVLYSFMDRHSIFVKAQGDAGSHIRYSLYQSQHKDVPFDVKLTNKKGAYSIEFKSTSPYLERRLPVTGQTDVSQQVDSFLEKNFSDWKRLRWSRRLNVSTKDGAVVKKQKVKKDDFKTEDGKIKETKLPNKKSSKKRRKHLKGTRRKKRKLSLKTDDKGTAKKMGEDGSFGQPKRILNRHHVDRPSAKDLRSAELNARQAVFSTSPIIPNFQKNNIPNNNKSSPGAIQPKTLVSPIEIEPNSKKGSTEKAKSSSVTFVEDLDSSGERRLVSVDELVLGAVKAAVAASDGLEMVSEGPNKWEITLDAKGPHSNARICTISLSEEDSIQILELNNEEIPAMETQHRMARRHVHEEDAAEDVQDYIHTQMAGFLEDYVTIAKRQTGIEQLAAILTNEIFEPRGKQLIRGDEVDDGTGEPTFLVLNHLEESSSSKIETQIRLFRVNADFNQIQMTHRQKTVELQVPRLLADEQHAALKREIEEVLDDQQTNSLVDFSGALKVIENVLKETLNCGSVSVQEEGGGTAVMEVGEGCSFSDMSFVLTNFDYGYLQYIHMLLDNQYFQTEHLLSYTLEGDFHENLKSVLVDMQSTLEEVKTAQDSSSEDITLEHITQMVKEVLENEVEQESLKDNETVFKRKGLNGKDITTIRIISISGDDGTTSMFRVFLFDPRVHAHHFSRSKSQHEYVLYANNGSDELVILKKDLQKLKHKLDDIRKKRKKN